MIYIYIFFKHTLTKFQEFNCKKVKTFVTLATIAVISILAAAASWDENELTSRKAEIQSALEQAMI